MSHSRKRAHRAGAPTQLADVVAYRIDQILACRNSQVIVGAKIEVLPSIDLDHPGNRRTFARSAQAKQILLSQVIQLVVDPVKSLSHV